MGFFNKMSAVIHTSMRMTQPIRIIRRCDHRFIENGILIRFSRMTFCSDESVIIPIERFFNPGVIIEHAKSNEITSSFNDSNLEKKPENHAGGSFSLYGIMESKTL